VSRFLAILRVNRQMAQGDWRLPAVGIAFPLLISFTVGIIFGGHHPSPVGLLDNSKGPVNTQLVTMLKAFPDLELRSYSNVADLNDDVMRQRVVAGLIVPSNFAQMVTSGKKPAITLIAPIGNQNSSQARAYILEIVGVVSSEWNAAEVASQYDHQNPIQAFRAATSLTGAAYKELVKQSQKQSQTLSPYSYTTPSQAVLFVFMLVMGAASAVVEIRKAGLFKRMLASPISPWTVVLAQMLGNFLLAFGEVSLLLLMGRLAFGVQYGSFIAVFLLVFSISLAAAGFGTVAGVIAKTPEQAVAISIVLGLVLGMLGGCLWPLSSVGPLTREFGHIAPQAWAMDAFVALVYSHASLREVLPDIAVLFLFGAVFATIGAFRFRKAMVNTA
jgi:ABC-2 type transport system permease protein